MEFLASLVSFFFVALAMAAMFMFGFVLLAWLIGAAIILWAIFLIRFWYYRRFVLPRHEPPSRIIEVEYKDISK